MPECLAFSRFSGDAWGDGGQRRSVQMRRLLAAYAPRFENMAWERSGSRGWRLDDWCDHWLGDWNSWSYGLLRMRVMTGPDFFWWSPLRRRFIWLSRCAAKHHAARIPPARPGDVAIVDDPLFFVPLVRALKRRGWPVIALAQNLESLSRWQVTARGQGPLLNLELKTLAACALTITVSRDENVLLRNLGINTFFVPYHPPAEVVAWLMGIRAARAAGGQAATLLLGSGGNLSTLQGMAAVIRLWITESLARRWGPLRVAGFGTEALREAAGNATDAVQVLGSLSQEAMEAELIRARACICHQEEGAGALTRITDLLMAGVPVVGSEHALRSYHHIQGSVAYALLAGLPTALERVDSGRPPPPPEAPDAAQVQALVKAIVGPGWDR